MAISTNGTIITRLAGSLYGEYLSNASYTELNTTAASTVAANMLTNDFAGKTDAQIATTVLTNLSLTTIAGLDNWVAAQLTAAGSTAAAKGAKLVSMLNDYAMMTADATYGASATSFNAKTEASLVKSQTTGTKSGSFATADVVALSTDPFVLTTGTDVADTVSATRGTLNSTFKFTSGNDTINASIGTLNAADVLLDNSSTDADVLNVTLNADAGEFTAQSIETIAVNAAAGTPVIDMTKVFGTTAVTVSGNVAAQIKDMDASIAGLTISASNYSKTLTVTPATLVGTTALSTAETVNIKISGATFGTTTATQSALVISAGAAGTLETLNITSDGTAVNTFSLATGANGALGTVNLLGGADATVRVTHADITGVTVAGAANTANTTLVIDRHGVTTTPTNLGNVSGIDKIQFRDATVGTDAYVANGLLSGSSVELISTFASVTGNVLDVAGSAAGTADSLTLTLDHATANTIVAGGTVNMQDIETVNLVSKGADTVLIAAGNTLTYTGDATKINVSGDTAFDFTFNVDTPTSGSRTTVLDSSTVTGTATVKLNASNDTNTTNLYTMTGTANSDTLLGGAGVNNLTGGAGNDSITGGASNDVISGGDGNDLITATAGIDSVTGGAGNDTFVIPVVAATTAAVAETQTITPVNGNEAANVVIHFVVNVLGTDVSFVSDASPTAAKINTGIAAAINASIPGMAGNVAAVVANNIVTLTFKDTLGDVANVTIKAIGGTAGTAVSGGSATAANLIVTTVADGTVGTVGDLVDVVLSDFAAGDLINKAALTGLAAGGYYEGNVAGMTAGTDYGLVVITDQAYALTSTLEGDINTKLTNAVTTDQIFVYLDSALGHAVAVYDNDISGNGAASLNQIIAFTGITTLAQLAAAFADNGTTFV
jgi:hypothetical protein